MAHSFHRLNDLAVDFDSGVTTNCHAVEMKSVFSEQRSQPFTNVTNQLSRRSNLDR
jgi:hypothetical protein